MALEYPGNNCPDRGEIKKFPAVITFDCFQEPNEILQTGAARTLTSQNENATGKTFMYPLLVPLQNCHMWCNEI